MTWWGDYNQGKKDFTDLAVTIGIDLVKAGIVAAVASATVALVAAISAAAIGFSVPILAIAIGTAVALVIIGYGVDLLFNALDVNGKITKEIRGAGQILELKNRKDYDGTYSTSLWRIAEMGAGF
jgi:hypothetical protein